MRLFETVLILVNLLSLLLTLKKQPKAVWWGMVGGNLLAFLIHGIFEGLRYQMAFSYTFVVLIVLFTWIKTNTRLYSSHTPKILKGAALLLSFVSLVFTSFLAYALPVFALSKPTGSYDVGIQYFHWIDENRTDPFLDGSTQKRELMVKVYYPAADDPAKPYASYFHDLRLIRLFTAFYHLPEFAFDHLRLVKTNSKEGLQVSDRQQSYPVILFSHGAGTTMEVQTSQSEDLASHGYIVVAIDHTYVSVGTVFPDRIVSHHEATTDFKTVEPAEIITQIMADDSRFMIDRLGEMNDGKIDSLFQGRLDLEKIGAIGHSVGGAVAYNLAINEPRVKVAIDLDGVVFITPEDATEMAPFLMLATDRDHLQAIQNREPLMKSFVDMDELDQKITIEIHGSEQAYNEAYNRAQQNVMELAEVLENSGNLFTIEGSDHMKYTDIGLFIGMPQLRELINIRGETDPARCLEITQALTLAFFDQHLKGGEGNSLEFLVEKYAELQKVDLK
jgi:predicted dienelactone hydrolase